MLLEVGFSFGLIPTEINHKYIVCTFDAMPRGP
jgi:hypothetical protein